MDTNLNVFGNNRTTTGAFLRCASWVNVHHSPTSFFRFVGGELHELTPSYIRNAPADCLVSVDLHILDVELFKGDELVFVDQFARFLMSKVCATVSGTLVGVAQSMNNFAAFGRVPIGCLCKAFFLALQSGNVVLVYLHPALAVNLVAVAEVGKGGQSQVDTNNIMVGRQWVVGTFAREAGIEVTNGVALNCQRLDVGTDIAVQLNANVTYLGNSQLVTSEFETGLLEGERVVSTIALKAWIPRFFTRFHTAKERLKRKVNSLLYILQDLRMNAIECRLVGFPLRQKLISSIQVQRLFLLLIGVLASSKRLVIDETAKLKHSFEACTLCAGRE